MPIQQKLTPLVLQKVILLSSDFMLIAKMFTIPVLLLLSVVDLFYFDFVDLFKNEGGLSRKKEFLPFSELKFLVMFVKTHNSIMAVLVYFDFLRE